MQFGEAHCMDDGDFAERAAHRRRVAWTRLGRLGDEEFEELDPDDLRMTVEDRLAAVGVLSRFAWALKEGGDGSPAFRRSVTRLRRLRR